MESFFTPGGSFWTNNSKEILEKPSWFDPGPYPRNRCIHEGFESITLVPIPENYHITGLMQFNFRKKNRLNMSDVNTVERIARYLGEWFMRKKAEESFSHSQRLMSYIIEHMRSAVSVHDKERKYIYVSKRYLQEHRIKETDVIGKHHDEIFPDFPHKWREVHRGALAGEILSGENDPYEWNDGRVDRTMWKCRPWYETDGAVSGINVYSEDISGRMRAQEKLETRRMHPLPV
jgi:PAS domain S-box-containing protein